MSRPRWLAIRAANMAVDESRIEMKFARIALSAVLICTAHSVAAFGKAKPDPNNPQYRMGYLAGRRDERGDLCSRFEKHSAVAATLLGQARMVLIRAFCASRL